MGSVELLSLPRADRTDPNGADQIAEYMIQTILKPKTP